MKLLPLFAGLLTLGGLTACTIFPKITALPEPETSEQAVNAQAKKTQSNLVSLFLVKNDKLKNQFRGEIYPIALYLNGKYLDASTDVTTQVRMDYQEENLIRNNQQKTPLSAIKTFTVVDRSNTIGQFTVDRLGISQFACSSFLVGQGQFQGKQSLQDIFAALPESQSGGFSGSIGKKQFDETWRWTIAPSQYHESPMIKRSPPDLDKYKQDLLDRGNTLIAQSAKSVTGQATVEQMAVYDLNHDGRSEVFGIVRKGPDPASIRPERLGGLNKPTTAYATVWLSYQNDRLTAISSEVVPYTAPVSRRPYDVIGTLDINGDGVEEVIVRTNGYESTGFRIYEFDGHQLKQVFDGAGYGC